MLPKLCFFLSIAFSFGACGIVTAQYLWPQLRFRQRAEALRLVEEVRAQGYAGSVDTVRRFVHSLQAPRRAQEKLTVRYETPPGEQAQVDCASLGRFANQEGKVIPIYVFVMVLGFSRYMYIEFTSRCCLKSPRHG